jgi:hypothetical protein
VKALVEQGLPGAVLYVSYVLLFLKTSLATMRRSVGNPVQFWLASSIAAAGACLFGQEMVEAGMVFGGSPLGIVFMILLAIQTKIAMARPRGIYFVRRSVQTEFQANMT